MSQWHWAVMTSAFAFWAAVGFQDAHRGSQALEQPCSQADESCAADFSLLQKSLHIQEDLPEHQSGRLDSENALASRESEIAAEEVQVARKGEMLRRFHEEEAMLNEAFLELEDLKSDDELHTQHNLQRDDFDAPRAHWKREASRAMKMPMAEELGQGHHSRASETPTIAKSRGLRHAHEPVSLLGLPTDEAAQSWRRAYQQLSDGAHKLTAQLRKASQATNASVLMKRKALERRHDKKSSKHEASSKQKHKAKSETAERQLHSLSSRLSPAQAAASGKGAKKISSAKRRLEHWGEQSDYEVAQKLPLTLPENVYEERVLSIENAPASSGEEVPAASSTPVPAAAKKPATAKSKNAAPAAPKKPAPAASKKSAQAASKKLAPAASSETTLAPADADDDTSELAPAASSEASLAPADSDDDTSEPAPASADDADDTKETVAEPAGGDDDTKKKAGGVTSNATASVTNAAVKVHDWTTAKASSILSGSWSMPNLTYYRSWTVWPQNPINFWHDLFTLGGRAEAKSVQLTILILLGTVIILGCCLCLLYLNRFTATKDPYVGGPYDKYQYGGSGPIGGSSRRVPTTPAAGRSPFSHGEAPPNLMPGQADVSRDAFLTGGNAIVDQSMEPGPLGSVGASMTTWFGRPTQPHHRPAAHQADVAGDAFLVTGPTHQTGNAEVDRDAFLVTGSTQQLGQPAPHEADVAGDSFLLWGSGKQVAAHEAKVSGDVFMTNPQHQEGIDVTFDTFITKGVTGAQQQH